MNRLWRNLVKAVAGHKILSLVVIAAVAGTGFTGIKLVERMTTKELPKVSNVEIINEVQTPTKAEQIPEFKEVVITSESVEKDFTLYFSDSEDNNITGQAFNVKLIDPEETEKLQKYVDAIENLNIKIADYKSKEEDEKTLLQLYEDKQVALEAYSVALEELEGNVYSDSDMDGVISEKDVEPGNYVACMLYQASDEINYEPTNYETQVEVKDKVEYKAVKNITKKIEKDKTSEDGQKSTTIATETTLTNTVDYVDSSSTNTGSSKSTTDVAVPADSTSAGYKLTVTDNKNGKAEHTYTKTGGDKNGTKYTVTYLYQDILGNQMQSTSAQVDAGTVITVSAGSYSGYVFDHASPEVGTQITVNSDTTITYYFDEESAFVGRPVAAKSINPIFSRIHLVSHKKTASSTSKITQTVTLSVDGTSTLSISAALTGEPAPTITSVTVNGNAAALDSSGKYEYKASVGTYKIVAGIIWGDGSSGTASLTAQITEEKTASDEALLDKSGNKLYLDEKCEKEAKASDYQAGKTYYYPSGDVTYTGWQTINGVTYFYDKDGKKVTGTQVIQGVKYNFGSDGALLVSGTGIDVSKYQGNIDWAKAKGAISFAIIRCGYRGMYDGALHEDPYFYKNMKNAKANGVAVGIYIYSTALNEAEAVEEASMAVAMAQNAGGCSYPIYLDMEDNVRGVSKLTKAERSAIVNAFVTTVQNSGYKAGIYASRNWLSDKMSMSDVSSSAYVWVAQYNTSCTYGGKYTMWQYSSQGTIPGISGNVDVDKSYF